MVCVLPGVEDVFAKFFLVTSILMRDDLPTFDRPMNANSGKPVVGDLSGLVLLMTNSAFLMINLM